MAKNFCAAVFVSTALVGCAPQLSPVQLVGPESSDVAVLEFLFAGRALAGMYGFDFTFERVPLPVKPGMTLYGTQIKHSIPYDMFLVARGFDPNDRYRAREYFIRAGHHASQIICRNYLSGLRDRNEYFEFLQKEFQVAANLTSILLTITHAAEKSKDIFTQVVGATNLGVDAYQGFRFLAPEIETVLPLVEAAQVAMRDYYTIGKGIPATFAGALNAVSKIEYQCSRSGIRAILNKTLVQSKPQYTVIDGTLYAHQAETKKPEIPDKPAPAGGK
jgi:hypothetical protein